MNTLTVLTKEISVALTLLDEYVWGDDALLQSAVLPYYSQYAKTFALPIKDFELSLDGLTVEIQTVKRTWVIIPTGHIMSIVKTPLKNSNE